MEKFYCPQCKAELDKSEVRAEIESIAEDNGHGSPTFYKRSKYYCIKHNPPVPVETKQNGFIQIPILIAIIIGTVVISGAIYFGVKIYEGEKTNTKNAQEFITQQQKAVEEARSEIENLKKKLEDDSKQQKAYSNSQGLTNSQIIQKVKPAVVFIETETGAGSGMIIDGNGLILTNAHVVSGAQQITVTISSSQRYSARTIGIDENKDLALIKITASNLPTVELGDSSETSLHQGDPVFTLGFPFGLGGDVSFKDGTLSRRKTLDGMPYLEISAEIHPGNSGGPLVNKFGQVIGINSLAFGLGSGGVLYGETIKFAIPIDFVKLALGGLETGQFVAKNDLPSGPITLGQTGHLSGYVILKSSDYAPLSEKGKFVFDPTITKEGQLTKDLIGCNTSGYFSGYVTLYGFQITIDNGSVRKSAILNECNANGAYYLTDNVPLGVYNVSITLPRGYRFSKVHEIPKTIEIKLGSPDRTGGVGENGLWIWIVKS